MILRFQPDGAVCAAFADECISPRTGEPYARVEWSSMDGCLVVRELRPDDRTWVTSRKLLTSDGPRQVTFDDLREVLSRRNGHNHVLRAFREFMARKETQQAQVQREYDDAMHYLIRSALVHKTAKGAKPLSRIHIQDWESERRRRMDETDARRERRLIRG